MATAAAGREHGDSSDEGFHDAPASVEGKRGPFLFKVAMGEGARADPVGLHAFIRGYQELRDLGVPAARVRVVVNQLRPGMFGGDRVPALRRRRLHRAVRGRQRRLPPQPARAAAWIRAMTRTGPA